jgi:hypothetical protein
LPIPILSNIKSSQKGSPKPSISNSLGMAAQNIIAVLIPGGKNCLADFLAAPTEEMRRAEPTPGAARIKFACCRKRRKSVRGVLRDGKAKQEQQPVLNFSFS